MDVATNVTVEPAEDTMPIEENMTTEEMNNKFSDIFKQFADAIGGETKKTFGGFADYIKSAKFNEDLKEKADKYKVPPKQLAKSFFLKVFGIIGDIAGIVVNTACNIFHTAINILSTVLHGTVDVIHNIAYAIGSIFTFNQTAVA